MSSVAFALIAFLEHPQTTAARLVLDDWRSGAVKDAIHHVDWKDTQGQWLA